MNLKIVLYILTLLSGSYLKAQTLQGQVYDASNLTPLPATAILNLTDSSGTVANEKGEFELILTGKPILLKITHLGYLPAVIKLDKVSNRLRIGLQAAQTSLKEVIVTASQISERLADVPAAVNMITRNDMERNNEVSIAPLLNRIPGVYMHSGGLNTNRITIRGAGARTQYGTNKIKAYFNDIPLTNGEGETTLEDIDLAAMQRVEVIKGPTSSIYGAGLGGTIKISPQTGALGGSSARMKSTLGSYAMAANSFQYAYGDENAQFGLTYSDTYTDGFRENSQYDRRSAVLHGLFNAGEKSTLTFLSQYLHLKAYIPSSLDEQTFTTNPSAAASTWKNAQGFEAYDKASMGLSHQYQLNKKIKNITSLFLHFRKANEPRPFNILKENTIATGIRSRMVGETFVFRKATLFSLGFEYFSDWYEWSTYNNLYQSFPGQGSILGEVLSDNREQRTYYNIFGQVNYQFSKKLSFQGGVNINGTQYKLKDFYTKDSINQSGKYSFERMWSPRAAFTYKINNNFTLYTSASHGFSPPSLAETLTPEGIINTDIQPETGWNYEAGGRAYLLNGRLHTALSLYRMVIKDLLVARRTGPDRYVGVNAGRTVHNGMEISFSVDLADDERWSLKPHISGTLMHYRFDEFNDQENDYAGNKLTGVPSTIINGGVDLQVFGAYFFSNYRYVSAIPLNDSNSKYSNSYGIVNCKAGYKFMVWNNFEINLSAGVNNITDEAYASMVLVNAVGFGNSSPRYFYPGMPRNYYGSVAIAYKF